MLDEIVEVVAPEVWRCRCLVSPAQFPKLVHFFLQDDTSGAQLSDFDFMIQLGDKSLTLRAGRFGRVPSSAVHTRTQFMCAGVHVCWLRAASRNENYG